jgi:hypoxanthine-DNA glycosylase
MEYIEHKFAPVYDANSEILILGTMPSRESRKNGFYYSNPQNRFWKVLYEIFSEKLQTSIEDRKRFLHKHHIALWDVLKSCSIEASSDGSIKDPVVNDFTEILTQTNIKYIFTTGKKAYSLYKKYCEAKTSIKVIYLPSTSPANCAYSYERLLKEYKLILNFL